MVDLALLGQIGAGYPRSAAQGRTILYYEVLGGPDAGFTAGVTVPAESAFFTGGLAISNADTATMGRLPPGATTFSLASGSASDTIAVRAVFSDERYSAWQVVTGVDLT